MLPRWASEPNPEDEADDERIRRMSPNERLAELVEIWRLMDSILRGRRDPLPESWLAIVERSRRARRAR